MNKKCIYLIVTIVTFFNTIKAGQPNINPESKIKFGPESVAHNVSVSAELSKNDKDKSIAIAIFRPANEPPLTYSDVKLSGYSVKGALCELSPSGAKKKPLFQASLSGSATAMAIFSYSDEMNIDFVKGLVVSISDFHPVLLRPLQRN